MKLVWHIAAKDLRRLAWPLAGWLALLAGTTIWLSVVSIPMNREVDRARRMVQLPHEWIHGVDSFMILIGALVLLMAVVLAAFLVLQDPPVGTATFWATRPISGARLLAAKLLAAALAFVVAPTVLLMPVWLASGFSSAEVAQAALQHFGGMAVFVALAIGAASLTENLGTFLLAAIAGLIVFVLFWFGDLWHTLGTPEDLTATRSHLVTFVPIAILVPLLARQYLGARRAAWWIPGLGVGVMLLIRLAWPLDLTATWPSWRETYGLDRLPAAQSAEEIALRPVLPARLALSDENVTAFTVRIEGLTAPGALFAPQHIELKYPPAHAWEQKSVWMTRGPRWAEEAALRIAGLRPDSGAIGWEMVVQKQIATLVETEQMQPAKLDFALDSLRGRVLWEMPLREDATGRAGSSFARLAGLGWIQAGRAVLLQERETQPLAAKDEGDRPSVDCYLVLHRGRKFAAGAPILGDVAVGFGGIALVARTVEFAPPVGADELSAWEQGATLLKVRFERERTFRGTAKAPPFTISGGNQP